MFVQGRQQNVPLGGIEPAARILHRAAIEGGTSVDETSNGTICTGNAKDPANEN